MTGVLNVKVGGTWVPLAVGVTTAGLPPPAYVGPKIDNVNVARFGNTGGDQNVGYLVANDGYIDAVMGAAKSLVLWDTAHGSGNFIGKFSYDTGRGQLDIGRIYVPSGTGQHITLYGTPGSSNTFGTGIQGGTLYNRVGSTTTNGFAWHRGGVHSDTQYDPGAGGTKMMHLTGTAELHVGFVGGSAVPLSLIGSTNNAYMRFYCSGDTSTRSGYIGYPGNAALYIRNEIANENVYLYTAGTGSVRVYSGGTLGLMVDSDNEVHLGGRSAAGYGANGWTLGPTSNTFVTSVNHGGINMCHTGAGDVNASRLHHVPAHHVRHADRPHLAELHDRRHLQRHVGLPLEGRARPGRTSGRADQGAAPSTHPVEGVGREAGLLPRPRGG